MPSARYGLRAAVAVPAVLALGAFGTLSCVLPPRLTAGRRLRGCGAVRLRVPNSFGTCNSGPWAGTVWPRSVDRLPLAPLSSPLGASHPSFRPTPSPSVARRLRACGWLRHVLSPRSTSRNLPFGPPRPFRPSWASPLRCPFGACSRLGASHPSFRPMPSPMTAQPSFHFSARYALIIHARRVCPSAQIAVTSAQSPLRRSTCTRAPWFTSQ